MVRRNITPALSDITQDIAGEIPLKLINSWLYSDRDQVSYTQLLAPYKVRGVVVSTDSSGLSRLSQNKSLFEIIKLISHPKQLAFLYGSAIGGTPIGTWAADNTQMFYPKSINLKKIIQQMAWVFRKLQTFDLKIGMAIHKGEFVHLGDGLYGEDAEHVEGLAESFAEGGQMLITSRVLSELDDELKTRAKLKEGAIGAFDFDYTGIEEKVETKIDTFYPIPFSKTFYQDLMNTDLENQESAKALDKKYLQNKIVVLVRIFHQEQKFLLDQLIEWVEANALIEKTRKRHDIFKIKSNGNLGIFVCDDAKKAMEFAKKLKADFSQSKYKFNIGISSGEVLVSDIDQDNWDIAGEPVNIASKIAEDSKEKNKILIEESVEITKGGTPFKLIISGVEIKGVGIE